MDKREERLSLVADNHARQTITREMTAQEAQCFLQGLPEAEEVSVVIEIPRAEA